MVKFSNRIIHQQDKTTEASALDRNRDASYFDDKTGTMIVTLYYYYNSTSEGEAVYNVSAIIVGLVILNFLVKRL